jgi:SPP1 family predicted phage head-tail adaptor
MEPGKLRHTLTIQRNTPTTSETGAAVDSWSTYKTVRGSIQTGASAPGMGIRGREFFAADIRNSEVSHNISIRYTAGITPKMRVLFGARTFDIVAAVDIEERHHEMTLLVRELNG